MNKKVTLPPCDNHAFCFAKNKDGCCVALGDTDWPGKKCPFWKAKQDGPNLHDRMKIKEKSANVARTSAAV